MQRLLALSFVLLLGSFLQGAETQRQYLSGKDADNTVQWEFQCSEGRNSGYWSKIAVPSCWELQGFGTYNYGMSVRGKEPKDPAIANEKGRYRHQFTVPASWKSLKIGLVFEGSMTDTEVWLNGKSAGEKHQGAFYRFKYDVSSLLNYGSENTLEVLVAKESANESVNEAERRGDYWNFGGIFRPVYLEATPAYAIDQVAVDASAKGELKADLRLSSAAQAGDALLLSLSDKNGRELGTLKAALKAGDTQVRLSGSFENVVTWNAENPVLYTARFELKRGDASLHHLSKRIGFRSFEVRPGQGFFLNGSRVLLKGVNRHCFWPDTGRTMSARLDLEDIRLMKEMNMNTVRSSHYPPDESFLDLCDEKGLYVLNELGGWHGFYETGVGRKLLRSMIERDVNHPSIIFWDNGNEGGWNIELDEDFALLDIQKRPVLHPMGLFSGVHTFHYRSYDKTKEFLKGPAIFFPTEFLHGLFDGGHGAGLHDYWELMRQSPFSGGGLFWVFADEGVVRSDQGGRIDNAGNFGPDGIVGPRHEKEGSFYTIREIWAPVQLGPKELPADFRGALSVENRYDFTNLKDCRFAWRLLSFPGAADMNGQRRILAEGIVSGPDLAPGMKGSLQLPLPPDFASADALQVIPLAKDGSEIWTASWRLQPNQKLLRFPKLANTPATRDDGIYVSLSSGPIDLRLDWESGYLDSVYVSGKPMRLGKGPRFVAMRRADRNLDGTLLQGLPKGEDRKYVSIPDTGKMLSLTRRMEDGRAVLEVTYDGILKKAVWRIDGSGVIQLDYEYAFEGVVDLMGVEFAFPEKRMKSITWLGRGPCRSWQNRREGTVFDLWQKAYGDGVPGIDFDYPEFKGFFQGWAWARFETEDGSICFGNGAGDTHLGVYAPRDGRGALLHTFPNIGLSILDVVPPVRNKVDATELIGPQSQPHRATGLHHGTLFLRFEARN